ncbi:MAG: flagellar hook-length control protein FliK [Pseudomonadota bacterium]
MMPPLMPSLDTAVSKTALPTAGSADGAAEGNVFSALIQDLQPAAATTAASLLSLKATDLAVLPAVQALPASTDTLAGTSVLSALASVLNDLGLNESRTEPELDTQADISAEDVAGSTEAGAVSPTLLPAVPLLLPTLPTLSEATLSAETAAVDAAAMTPAQSQVRQWLAAFAPAVMASDSPSTGSSDALDGQRAPIPAGLPTVTAVPVSNAWVQQPLAAAFFNMSAVAEAAPVITERFGLSLESTAVSLPTDAAKGLASTISFAQQLSSPQSSAPVLTTLLPHALQDPAWSDAFGQRIAMLAQQGTQSATLQLNPPDLGPIQVRIAMSEQGARVEFNTLQQTTSDLIETAMPRLAAALEHQGLRLDDSRVNLLTSRQDVFSAQSAFSSARQDTPQGERGQAMPQPSRAPTDTAESESGRLPGAVIKLPEQQKRGIDYYA